jgi:hypothetical protein
VAEALKQMDPHVVAPVEKQAREAKKAGTEADTTSANKSRMADPPMEADAQGEEKREATIQERGIVPHVNTAADSGKEEEEQEYDFAGEVAEGAVQPVRWLAIARFYSSHVPNAKIMFE